MRYRVLIVDDERDVLNVIKEMLTNLGYEASGETSGIKAIELIKKGNFDLVIADLIMPGKSGLEILKEVKNINRKTPVIITAGVDLDEANIDLFEYGLNEFIKKPFTFEDIKAKLQKCFKGPKKTTKAVS